MFNWLDVIPAAAGPAVVAVVDGGATHSRAVISRLDGEVLSYTEGGPTNARTVGNAQATANLIDVLRRGAESQPHPTDLDVCLVATAGLATRARASHLSGEVQRQLWPGAKVEAVPDTLSCWAIAGNLGPAVVAVAGTGSAVLAADIEAGFCKSYGNWDFVLGDEGSGFAIGRAALRETLRYAEGRSAADAIAHVCLENLGLADPQEIPDAVHAHIADKALIASLAEPVLNLAADGVPEAVAIVAQQAGLLAETTIFAYEELRARDPAIGCFGGVFKNPAYLAEFQRAVSSETCRRPTPAALDGLPLSGAFRLLLHASGLAPGSGEFGRCAARFDELLRDYHPR